jgi:hypothetical protein
MFAFSCISHDPPLSSPAWGLRPERLAALLAVRANLVGLAGVASVQLAAEAEWLLLHPNCEVVLATDSGVAISLDDAVALADAEDAEDVAAPAPPEAEPAGTDREDDEDVSPDAVDEAAAVPDVAVPVALAAVPGGQRRPRSMPPPDVENEDGAFWRCQGECGGLVGEREALLSWTRRIVLCPTEFTARKVS